MLRLSPDPKRCIKVTAPVRAHGIDVFKHLPGVGKNLQDYLQNRLVYKTNLSTLNDELNRWWKRTLVGIQYFLSRTGPLTLAASQVVVFTRSNPSLERPDIQFHMQPLAADCH